MSHHRRYRRMVAASGPNRAILSLLCPPMVAAATCPSARQQEIGVQIPLLRDRPRYPRFPVERVRDISCEACESRLLALPPRCSSPELALHTVLRTGQEGTPSTARSAPGGRVARTRSAISPQPGREPQAPTAVLRSAPASHPAHPPRARPPPLHSFP